MNNEPVAWKALNELNGSYSAFTNEQKNAMLPHISQLYGKWIPLYNHPAKTLTDEDLHKLIKKAEKERFGEMYITGLIDCFDEVRAILKKAQEK